MRDYSYTVDINSRMYQVASYKQYDNNIPYTIYILEEGEPIDLTGYTVLAYFEKPDKITIQKDCIIDIQNSSIKTILDNNILSNAGNVNVEFVFYKNDIEVTTFTLKINVQKSINRNEAVESVPQWDIIDNLLNFDTNVVAPKLASMQSQVNAKLVENDNTVNDLVNQFNALAPTESTNAEVQLARTDVSGVTHASLKERLDMMEINPNIIWETVEG